MGPQRDFKKTLEMTQRCGQFEVNCNQMCQNAAARGVVAEAQRWAAKLGDSGKALHMESFDALLRCLCASGDLEGAERWFKKTQHPALHPELLGLQPDTSSFNIMVQAFADRGNLPMAECFAKEAASLDMGLHKKSYELLVDACLLQGDVRRAHRWTEAMVEAGFTKLCKDVMRKLICGLTEAGNVQSAHKWIAHMSTIGVPMDSETYARVRAAHPMDILPCKLSGEFSGSLAAPCIRPVKLVGEASLTPWLDGSLPLRPASSVLPSRSPRLRAAMAKWPANLVVEVRREATKKMSPPLKAEFMRLCSGQDAAENVNGSAAVSTPRAPRHRYITGLGHYTQCSYVASATMPPKGGAQATERDASFHPYWLDSGPPVVPFQRLQYGGP